MKKFYLVFFGISISFLLAACQPTPTSLWQSIDAGLDRAVFLYESQNVQKNIVVYKIDQKHFSFIVSNQSQPRTLQNWSEELDATLVVNGGYFHEDLSPSGLLITEGEVVSTRQFDYDKSGAVVVDGDRLSILDLAQQDEDFYLSAEYVLQSYPFFINNSEPAITQDSKKIAHRTVIGIDQNDFVYLIITPSGDLSLYQLMLLMDQWPIDFKELLNLDGGMSSGLVVNNIHWQEEIHGASLVPSVLSVHQRRPSL